MIKSKIIYILILIITLLFLIYILISPKIYLIGSNHVYLVLNHQYIELGATAIDLNKNISDQIEKLGYVNINKLGTYKITYTVKENKLSSKVTRLVTVTKEPPIKKSTIYLTFDDGPSNITNKLLDVLKSEEVKATFFVLNWSDEEKAIIKRIVDDGNTIALHGYIHNYRKNYSSIDAYFNDLILIHDKVEELTGINSRIIRFIGGSSNTTSRFNRGIMTKLTKEVVERGYYYFDWNIDSKDTRRISSKRVYKNVIRKLGDKDTYIILMHDYDNNYKTVNALKKIIEYGKDNGYNFAGITEYTAPIKHKVRN